MKRRSQAAVALGAAAFLLAGCAGGGGGEAGSSHGITVAIAADPGDLNPITNATEAGQTLSSYAYESLVSFEAGKDPEGALAEAWTESTTEVSFTLKEGVVCSDGTPLTASDVKASFDYAGLEETGSPFKGVYFPASGLTIEADDDARTVTFTSEQPQSFLLATIGLMPVVCAAGVEDPSVLSAETVGTGPYVLADSSPGQNYTFELRDDYEWGPGGVTSETAGLPASVTLEVVESESTIANMLQSNDVQLGVITGPDRDRLDASGLESLKVPTRPGQIFFNQAEGRATHDVTVRQALASAIDRDAVGTVSTSGRGEPMKTMVNSFSNTCVGADATSGLHPFDTEAAAAALDAAGWTLGSDGVREKDGQKLELVLLYPGSSDDALVSGIELIQQQLAEVGVTATPTPAQAYTDVIFQGGDWDIVWAPISTTLPSTWQGILSGEFPPNGGNWTYNTNQEFFDLAAEAQALAGEESCDTWTAAQASLFENVEVLPFYEATETFYGKDLTFALNSNGLVIPTSLRMAE
ncbi:ABC transporter substrate-binding protein [Microbacterium album]|uniref:Peptide ABC transporter substrate-binding protein n=1 Tax=Microbacterium album TaxID=2053191 RepID=A0A917MKK4_9MICO|nr:ABC transporter substrate-binding protein [Microbacterium album]GGH33334.1 peptide ABC transporter substrate-binding protein [Microbacterium album]